MNPADWMVLRLVSQIVAGDRIVVGVATPLALCAAVVGRAIHPGVSIVVGGAYQPRLDDIAVAIHQPEELPSVSHGVLGQEALLERVQRGSFSLQFISPVQVDGAGRVNTVQVTGAEGPRWMAGPLAVPDIGAGVGRLVAYRAEHSRRVLVEAVDHVTAAATADAERSRFRLAGSGVAAVVTAKAELIWSDLGFSVKTIRNGITEEEVMEGCAFPLAVELQDAGVSPQFEELLERFDPSRVRNLEVGSAV